MTTPSDPTPGYPGHARPADADRPNPLGNAARSAGTLWAGLSGIVGAGASLGLLSGAQSAAINEVGQGLPGWILAIGVVVGAVIPAVGSLLGSFRTAAKARPEVTPTADPRSDLGVPLVPSPSAY